MTERNPDVFVLWSVNTFKELYAVLGKKSRKYLDEQGPTSDDTVLVTKRNLPDPDAVFLEWSFIPAQYKFKAEIVDFIYGKKFKI